ncbi:MAG TPA: RNA polymerase sigma factor [Pirellulaceae bacterium]|nr:RNA polymerase sigma factor [Pirellulaceae bacterium]
MSGFDPLRTLVREGGSSPLLTQRRSSVNPVELNLRPQSFNHQNRTEQRLQKFEGELLNLLPRLRRFARSLTRDVIEADDLCQVVIERALKSRSQWQEGTRLDAWMYMIMRNCWIDEQRSSNRRAAHFAPLEAADGVQQGSPPAFDQLRRMDLHSAMQALPAEQRELVALVWIEGLSYREAAALLNIPIGTLTSRLFRARKALITSLEPAR